MTINDYDTSKKPVEQNELKTPENLSPPIREGLETGAFTEVLGLSKDDAGKYHDKIDTLIEWAKTQSDDHSLENLKWTIRELGFKLGTPPLGEKQVNYMAEYAFLSLESQKVAKRLKEYERGR